MTSPTLRCPAPTLWGRHRPLLAAGGQRALLRACRRAPPAGVPTPDRRARTLRCRQPVRAGSRVPWPRPPRQSGAGDARVPSSPPRRQALRASRRRRPVRQRYARHRRLQANPPCRGVARRWRSRRVRWQSPTGDPGSRTRLPKPARTRTAPPHRRRSASPCGGRPRQHRRPATAAPAPEVPARSRHRTWTRQARRQEAGGKEHRPTGGESSPLAGELSRCVLR